MFFPNARKLKRGTLEPHPVFAQGGVILSTGARR